MINNSRFSMQETSCKLNIERDVTDIRSGFKCEIKKCIQGFT